MNHKNPQKISGIGADAAFAFSLNQLFAGFPACLHLLLECVVYKWSKPDGKPMDMRSHEWPQKYMQQK